MRRNGNQMRIESILAGQMIGKALDYERKKAGKA